MKGLVRPHSTLSASSTYWFITVQVQSVFTRRRLSDIKHTARQVGVSEPIVHRLFELTLPSVSISVASRYVNNLRERQFVCPPILLSEVELERLRMKPLTFYKRIINPDCPNYQRLVRVTVAVHMPVVRGRFLPVPEDPSKALSYVAKKCREQVRPTIIYKHVYEDVSDEFRRAASSVLGKLPRSVASYVV